MGAASMIVIDIGCAAWGGDQSIPYLVKEFSPHLLFGFDPAANLEFYSLGTAQVYVRNEAAWTYNGSIGFAVDGLRGKVDEAGTQVRCFDLAEFIRGWDPLDELVLKMDAEGAEYVLLPHLRDTGADERLKLAWVEWHCPACGTGWFSAGDRCGRCDYYEPGKRSDLEASMGCEMHQWNL